MRYGVALLPAFFTTPAKMRRMRRMRGVLTARIRVMPAQIRLIRLRGRATFPRHGGVVPRKVVHGEFGSRKKNNFSLAFERSARY